MRWLRPPLRLFWKRGFPPALYEGRDPAPPSPHPHPVRGGPQIQEPKWLLAPGVSSCLCPMKKERFLLLVPQASTHHLLPRAQMPVPLESYGDGDPSAQELELRGQGETPFSQLPPGCGDGRGLGLHPRG